MEKNEIKEAIKELIKSGEIRIILDSAPNPFSPVGSNPRLKVIIDEVIISKSEA